MEESKSQFQTFKNWTEHHFDIEEAVLHIAKLRENSNMLTKSLIQWTDRPTSYGWALWIQESKVSSETFVMWNQTNDSEALRPTDYGWSWHCLKNCYKDRIHEWSLAHLPCDKIKIESKMIVPRTSYIGARFGTLTQHLVHPSAPVMLVKDLSKLENLKIA